MQAASLLPLLTSLLHLESSCIPQWCSWRLLAFLLLAVLRSTLNRAQLESCTACIHLAQKIVAARMFTLMFAQMCGRTRALPTLRQRGSVRPRSVWWRSMRRRTPLRGRPDRKHRHVQLVAAAADIRCASKLLSLAYCQAQQVGMQVAHPPPGAV